MAHDEHLSNPHFPFERMDEIAFDLSITARDAHMKTSEAIRNVVDAALGPEPIDIAPTFIALDTCEPGWVSAILTTPILPGDINEELLTSPSVFYLDTLTALICSHMFNLELVNSGSSASEMIQPTLDIASMTEQSWMLRTAGSRRPEHRDQTIFMLPTTSRRISLAKMPTPGKYNIALQSEHVVFRHDLEPAEMDTPATF